MSSGLIVGYDGSPCAHAAFDAAVGLAQSTGDRIVVAFGYEPPVGYGKEIEAHREVVRQHGERVTAEAMARAAELDIDVEARARCAAPSSTRPRTASSMARRGR